ncbi:MAG: GntR family transcriptional regulator [Erysipelothrix sp.]|jgi:DNA-binding GntR family transcriptional regulator|nr:GntR family transcriptional regulator [Erysipelothrix sp.]
MYYLNIDKTSSTPIYKQIEDGIIHALDSHLLRTHDLLPKEDDLCEFFSISRTVVRQAYQSLEDQGVLYRIKGKGTFISATSHLTFNYNELLRLDKALIQKKSDVSSFILLNDSKVVHPATTLAVYFPINTTVTIQSQVYANPFGPLLFVEDTFHSKVNKEVQWAIHQKKSPFDALMPLFKGATLTISLEEATGPIVSILKLDLPDALHRIKISLLDQDGDIIVVRQYVASGKNTTFETLIEGENV